MKSSKNRVINKIIDDLGHAKKNINKLKGKVTSLAEELGTEEEQINLQEAGWKELLEADIKLSNTVTASGVSLSSEIYRQSNHMLDVWYNSNIDQSMTTASSTASASSALVLLATGRIPDSHAHSEINNYIDKRNDREEIRCRLIKIDQNLSDLFDNAWANLYTESKDQGRSSSFLMREVVRRIYQHFAPDKQVMKKYALKDKAGINNFRTLFISELLPVATRESFIKQAKALSDIYFSLSKAHKPSLLDIEETKGYLYQSNSLVKLILDSFEIT